MCGSVGLGFCGVAYPDLEKVEWHGEGVEPELFVEPELLEPEEVVADVFGEIAADELL